MHLQSREIVSPSNARAGQGRESFQVGPEDGYTLCRYPFARTFDVFLSRRGSGSAMGGAFADGFLGEQGLLADAIRDFREFALIRSDGGQIVNLTDEVERAKGFPNLFVAGVDSGDFGARAYVRARSHEECAD